jgi:hypothetical protein
MTGPPRGGADMATGGGGTPAGSYTGPCCAGAAFGAGICTFGCGWGIGTAGGIPPA